MPTELFCGTTHSHSVRCDVMPALTLPVIFPPHNTQLTKKRIMGGIRSAPHTAFVRRGSRPRAPSRHLHSECTCAWCVGRTPRVKGDKVSYLRGSELGKHTHHSARSCTNILLHHSCIPKRLFEFRSSFSGYAMQHRAGQSTRAQLHCGRAQYHNITTAYTMLAMTRCAVALVTIALVSNAMVTEGESRVNTAPAGVCTTVTSVSVTATWSEPPRGIGLIYLGAFDGPDTPGPYAIQTADAAAALGEGGQLSVTMDNLLPNTKCAGHNVQCIRLCSARVRAHSVHTRSRPTL